MLWKYAQEQRIFEHMAMGQKWDTYVCDVTSFEEVRWDEQFFAVVHIEKYESREYEEYMCKICTAAKNFWVSMIGTKMTYYAVCVYDGCDVGVDGVKWTILCAGAYWKVWT